MVETYSARCADIKDTKHLREMLEDGNPTRVGISHVQNLKTQVVTKFMLLQRIAAAVGYDPGAGDYFAASRVLSTGTLRDRIERIIKTTPAWPGAFSSIKNHVQNLQSTGQSFPPSVPSGNLSSQQVSRYHGVKMLLGARNNLRLSAYHTAEGNLQLAAFMVHWHSTVS